MTTIAPFNELTRSIMDFLFSNIVLGHGSTGPVEIEGKIGTLVDRSTNQRVQLPVTTETILHPHVNVAFHSFMTMQQHRLMNTFLNSETEKSLKTKYRANIVYKHKREDDAFYELPKSGLFTLPEIARELIMQNNRKERVRVTTDQVTGKTLARIVKTRIADLNVYCPARAFDYRISINIEIPYTGDLGEQLDIMESGRKKDRVSYTHQCCQIDLTQVTPMNPAKAMNKTHELEVEVDAQQLRDQGIAAHQGIENRYEEMVNVFLNNIRVLTRVIGPDPPRAG